MKCYLWVSHFSTFGWQSNYGHSIPLFCYNLIVVLPSSCQSLDCLTNQESPSQRIKPILIFVPFPLSQHPRKGCSSEVAHPLGMESQCICTWEGDMKGGILISHFKSKSIIMTCRSCLLPHCLGSTNRDTFLPNPALNVSAGMAQCMDRKSVSNSTFAPGLNPWITSSAAVKPIHGCQQHHCWLLQGLAWRLSPFMAEYD